MLAMIPARGGSKGVPGKNIKEIEGKPLIAYTIEAALKAKSIDRVIVTTDSEEIAEVARKYGAEVPFMRPAYLAEDTSKAQDVYIHASEFMRDNEGMDVSKFMVLLPTAPFRTENHIDEAVKLFKDSKAETLISVTEVETPPSWMVNKDEKGFIENCGFDADSASGNRQGNLTHYVPNGAIYILDYELLKAEKTYYCDKTIRYEMSRDDSIDIDTMEDYEYAVYMMAKKKKEI